MPAIPFWGGRETKICVCSTPPRGVRKQVSPPPETKSGDHFSILIEVVTRFFSQKVF